ncbi:MAG TPA: SAM-dependent methyltransferase, partial [Actinophytocola sp.]|uniref:SAM-dependent methyltransferase n=1 Tax=Actinophytocola sp. TaxID=1872138 RepID=UPI002E020584|nr:SAM-dependent methyltransferase [Actinophytocola sp.]
MEPFRPGDPAHVPRTTGGGGPAGWSGYSVPNELPDRLVASIDVDKPNLARIYDYFLGGACNFAPDRELADRLVEVIPEAE